MSKQSSDDTRVLSLTGASRPGALVFAILAAIALAIYAWTILGTARNAGDWLLILPVAGIGVAAFVWAVIADGRSFMRSGKQLAAHLPKGVAKPVMLLFLIAAYAISLPVIGFDIGTAVFLGLALLVQGERRIWLILLNALVGTALIVWVFHGLLTVRLPLQLF